MPSTSKPLTWLLVGPGDIATRRVKPALLAIPDSRLVAICGRAGSPKAAALATRTGHPAVFDIRRALAESGASRLCANQPVHARWLRALAPQHVFCEKPSDATPAMLR